MKVYRSLDDTPPTDRPVCLAVGVFDGFHRGHQQVVARARARAAACGGEAWLLTFEPNPVVVLRPEQAPPRILSADARRRIAESQGLAGYIEHPFTQDFSHLSPEAFVRYLLLRVPRLKAIVVGANWRFGYRAAGDAQRLAHLGAEHGFEVEAATPVLHNGLPVSSTRIRQALLAGDVAEARSLLGRPHTVAGIVVHGAKNGRHLGFPTANVAVEDEILPPHGIYAVQTSLDGRCIPSAAYRGPGSTVPGRILEVHLLDFDGDLYGKHLVIHFHERVREDRRFATSEELARQIARDVAAARAALAHVPEPQP